MDLWRLLAAWILRVGPASESTRRRVENVLRLRPSKAVVEGHVEGQGHVGI